MKRQTILISMLLCVCVLTSVVFAGCGAKEQKPTEAKKTGAATSDSAVASPDSATPDSAGIDYMVLVNKTHKLPDDWESKVVLKEATNRYGETYKVEEKALAAFEQLQATMLEEGIIIELDSTYRSVAEQQQLWDDWTVEFGEDYVKKYVAVPGYSEHHTGLAIDICIELNGERINDNDAMIAETDTFAEIHKHLADYGFILRYLDGRDAITGYGYEPWHFRYIGDPVIAKQIMNDDITFEEYLGEVPVAATEAE